MTKVTSENLNQSVAGKYFRETDDAVLFLDPVYGTVLNSEEPPPSLLEDPMAVLGFDFLRTLSEEKRIVVQFFPAPHGGAADFRDILRDFGDVLAASPMVGVELEWNSRVTVSDLPELAGVGYILSSGRVKEFQEEQLAWLKEHEKIILPCDFPNDRKNDFGWQYIASFEQLLVLWKRSEEMEARRTAAMLYSSYQTVRQWTFIAQLGYWLYHLDKIGSLPSGNLTPPLILGADHVAVENKLADYLAIPAQCHLYDNENRTLGSIDKTLASIFADATKHARMTYEQVELYSSLR